MHPNHETLRRVMRAYVEGDLAPLMSAATDDVVWDSNAPKEYFRFGGRFTGHLGLKEALSLIASDFAILRYDTGEMVGEGDVVWVSNQLDVIELKTKSRAQFQLVNCWRFADGKIRSCSEYFDSAGLLLKLGRNLTE
ncbi:MAG TPA: nuclear transport factor 2 family protein [Rhizomicrobium sp.]|nr:nuclear transport factor 2 family protein [Rhizomicrobium sp.]